MPTTSQGTSHNRLPYVVTIFLILIALIVAIILLWPHQKQTPSIPPVAASCEEASGEVFTSTKYNLKFRYPCSWTKPYTTTSSPSNCPGQTSSDIIAFASSTINIDVNQCSTTSSARIEEQYIVTSKDGKQFTIFVFIDAFSPNTLRHIIVRSEHKVQLRANSVKTTDVAKTKADLEFIIKRLEVSL